LSKDGTEAALVATTVFISYRDKTKSLERARKTSYLKWIGVGPGRRNENELDNEFTFEKLHRSEGTEIEHVLSISNVRAFTNYLSIEIKVCYFKNAQTLF
jgi:hypothetical protein